MPKMFSPSKMFLKNFFAHENMKKPASKVAEPAQIQPKSQFLFHKNLPPRDFSLMTGTKYEDYSTFYILGRGRYLNWMFWRRGFWGRYVLPRNYSSSLIWFWALVHCIASLTLVRFGSILASRLPMYTVH